MLLIDQVRFVFARHHLPDLGHPLRTHSGVDVAAVVFQIDAVAAEFGLEIAMYLGLPEKAPIDCAAVDPSGF
jgi:hypothetical protein